MSTCRTWGVILPRSTLANTESPTPIFFSSERTDTRFSLAREASTRTRRSASSSYRSRGSSLMAGSIRRPSAVDHAG